VVKAYFLPLDTFADAITKVAEEAKTQPAPQRARHRTVRQNR
jgi:hypothetical protein